MGKGFGIVAIILSIIGIFVPIAGIFIGWAALIFAAVGALAGEVPFSIAVVFLSAFNYMFFSPSLWLATAGSNFNPGLGKPNIIAYVTVALVLAPLVALIVNKSGKFMIGSK